MPAGLAVSDRQRLEVAFTAAQQAGDLGPGPVGAHIDHSIALAACVRTPPGRLLDLGSGAGVPGLVWGMLWPYAAVTLLEGSQQRAGRLRSAVATLGLDARCEVIDARAESAGRRPELRETFDLVVARAFEGGPAVTAECGSGFVRPGGWMVVSEPPSGTADRWPVEGLARLGFGEPKVCGATGAAAVRIPKERALDDRFPRRAGVPRKRPLW